MTAEKDEVQLPKWFRLIAKVALHLTWGVVVLFIAFKFDFIKEGLSNESLITIKIVLICIGVPCVLLSGPEIMKIIKSMRNDK